MNDFWIKFVSNLIPSAAKRHEFRRRHSAVLEKYAELRANYDWGEYSYAAPDVTVADARTTVGRFCSIGPRVSIGTTMHPANFLSTSPVFYLGIPWNIGCRADTAAKAFDFKQPCRIGNDVWIGVNAVIMDGITVGDGAIIGAGAVVTHDVPPYAIVAGVPARLLRFRFDAATIDRLLAARWWNRPPEFIATLPFSDIEKCLDMLEQESSLHPRTR